MYESADRSHPGGFLRRPTHRTRMYKKTACREEAFLNVRKTPHFSRMSSVIFFAESVE
jgi:hypothetical protein